MSSDKGERHLAELDAWRGGAILLLLCGHFGVFFPMGRLGVEFFFVLSGRLMAEILFVRQTPLPMFYLRRASRILPALWMFVLAIWSVTRAYPAFAVEGIDVVKALTFTMNYFPGPPAMDHIWSLCIEEHAYLLLSVLAFFCRRWSFNVAGVLAAIAILCIINGALQTYVGGGTYYDVFWRTDTRGASIFMAAALYLSLSNKKQPSWLPVVAVIVGVLLHLAARVPDPVKYSVGTLLLAYGVVAVQSVPQWLLRAAANPILIQFGLWSFSIYLWQQPFTRFGTVGLLFVFPISLFSYYCVERPARAYLNGLAVRTPRRAVEAQPHLP
jgi:peptidoglycan/LPS O-acetylase OafA/YrhL